MGKNSNQIKSGIIMSYISIGVYILAGLLYTPWLVRTIGQSNYGLYILVISLINMFSLDFGLSAAVSRFVSKYRAENNQKEIDNLLSIVFKLYLIITFVILIVFTVTFFMLDTIYNKLDPSEMSTFKGIYVIAALFTIISFPFLPLNGILQSYEKFVQLKACDIFQKMSSVLLVIVTLLLGGGLYSLVLINVFSGLFVIIIKLFIIKRELSINVNLKYRSNVMLKEIFNFSVWSTLGSLAQRFIYTLTPTILGVFSGSISIAIYGIAASLDGYMYSLTNAMSGMFLPKVSRIIASNDKKQEGILSLMVKVGRIQFSIVGLIMVGFIILGKDFIVLWMGGSYERSFYCTVALILPSCIAFPQEIANTTVVAENKVKLQSLVFIGTAITNIILSITLSTKWGALGASISIAISTFLRIFFMNVIYKEVINIDIRTFYKECYLKMLSPMIITLFIGFIFKYNFQFDGWTGFVIYGLVIVLTYIAFMWAIALNQFEKKMLLQPVNNLFRILHLKKDN